MVDLAFSSLPLARPPTPPKDSIEGPLSALDDELFIPNLIDRAGLNTPTESPSSSAEYCTDAFGSTTKKVIFSPWDQYYKPMRIGSKSPDPSRALRPLPPSRERRSVKSILKCPVDISPAPQRSDARVFDTSSMASAMPAIMDALSQPAFEVRRDAYVALQGCLRAWERVADREKLLAEFGKIWMFVEKDCLIESADVDGERTKLASTALKTFLTIISIPELAGETPIAFRRHMLKQALWSLQADSVSVTLVTQYMQILRVPVMLSSLLPDQAQTLFLALDKVARSCKGNRILILRIIIYQSFLQQTPLSFTSHTQWIDHVLAGVLSSHKDFRTRAIVFGTTAALALGTNSAITKEWTETLNRKGKEGQTVFNFMIARMKTMIEVKEETIDVPQIWSIVTLFLRGRPKFIERWEHFKPWLGILQKCFNASDFETKAQANLAWDKLVFAVNPDLSTSQAIMGVLCQPIVTQLERKPTQKHLKQSRISARSSFCNLLHYAFRPGSSHEHLDIYWDRYISELMLKVVSKSPTDLGFFCKVLTMLFSNTLSRPWQEDAACRYHLKKPEQLPFLDPKWVRSRALKILKVFRSLDSPVSWRPDKSGKSPLEIAWRAFMQAIGQAATKEVKISTDTMVAVAAMLNFIQTMTSSSPTILRGIPDQATPTAYGKMKVLVDGAVCGIGSMPLNEKRILRSSQLWFEATETPSSRSVKHHDVPESPACHLLRLLVVTDNRLGCTAELKTLLEQVVAVNLRGAASRSKEFATLRMIASLSTEKKSVSSEAAVCLWEVISAFATESLLSPRTIFNGESPPQLGHEFRDCIQILETGIGLPAASSLKAWQELLAIMKTVVVEESCIEAVNLAIVEPLAASLSQNLTKFNEASPFPFDRILYILRLSLWPTSGQATERAHKMLWGSPLTVSKFPTLEPFEHLYVVLSEALELRYQDAGTGNGEEAAELLNAVAAFLETCPSSQGAAIIERLGQSIKIWVEDRDGKITNAVFGGAAKSCKTAASLPRLILFVWLTSTDEQAVACCGHYNREHKRNPTKSASI